MGADRGVVDLHARAAVADGGGPGAAGQAHRRAGPERLGGWHPGRGVGALVMAFIGAPEREQIRRAGPCDIDYVDIVDAESLEPLTTVDRPARICLAVRIGPCRLIDNVAVDVARCTG